MKSNRVPFGVPPQPLHALDLRQLGFAGQARLAKVQHIYCRAVIFEGLK
jgi:hypothetical protein